MRSAETNRTGWDVGWVPTREGIAPYPFQNGIEVWLAERGDKEPGHSDFWRAEANGRFALIRGYQEDEISFPKPERTILLDYHIALWRVSEVLLYLENFARQMEVPESPATLRITWNGLEGRQLCRVAPFQDIFDRRGRQDSVSTECKISATSEIKPSLIRAVHSITRPLFESFDFFSVTESQVAAHIKELFDPNKEIPGFSDKPP